MSLWEKLFGRTPTPKNPIQEIVVAEIRTHIVLAEARFGMLDGFWDSPYVLGWIQGSSYGFGEKLRGNSIDGKPIAEFQLDVLIELSDPKHQHVVDNLSRFMRNRDPVFDEAYSNAYLVSQYGILTLGKASSPPAFKAYSEGLNQFWLDRLNEIIGQ